MKKMTFENNLTYIYDAERRSVKYSLDGGNKWMNHGDYAECLAKSVLGYEPTKDGNTRFDKGEDIPELNASVKSWSCGLTDMKLGDTREEFLARFWEMSNKDVNYIWVNDYAEMVDLYFMDSAEFKEFVERFGCWDKHDKKIRIKICINKIVTYLEENL